MKLRPRLHSLLLLALVAITPPLFADDGAPLPLGPIGGTFVPSPGTPVLEVLSVTAGGPGAAAGLLVDDVIIGTFGEDFSAMSAAKTGGYVGSVQQLGEAIERAESGNVPLPLKVLRSGTGIVNLAITLPNVGAFGAAYPLGSPKFNAIYEYGCAQIHALALAAPSDADYREGWFGLCLLSHPNWNDTTGPTPYRNSINVLRDRGVARLTSAIHEPLEKNQAGFVDPGLETWALSMDAMFLSQYRLKSGDTAVQPTIQRAAELLANRVQYWQQPDEGNGYTPTIAGMMGHGGVIGDYLQYAIDGGLGIINAHAALAMGLLKAAGADFSGQSGTTAGSVPHPPTTYEERLQMCWGWHARCTLTTGAEVGNVGYQVPQENGYDSCARTAGAVAAFPLITATPTPDDTAKFNLMRGYLTRYWHRFQHSHAYTLGGVAFYQMALPRLPDRDQAFFMENARFYYNLSRSPDGSVAYMHGREHDGGDSPGYVGRTATALIGNTIARAIAGGTLPSFPNNNPTRLHAFMKSPWVSWPTLEAHAGKINGSAPATLEVEIADNAGVPVTSGLTSVWSQVSGPGTVTFGNSNALTTTATFSADGLYRVQLVASKDGYTPGQSHQIESSLRR